MHGSERGQGTIAEDIEPERHRRGNQAATETRTSFLQRKNPVYSTRGDVYSKLGMSEKSMIDFNKACELGIKEACSKAKQL